MRRRTGAVSTGRAARHLFDVRERARVVRVAAALAAASVFVVLVAGCGGNSLDTRRVQARLRVGITRKGVDVKSVQCPSKVDAKQGDNFTCAATDRAGTTERITVRQLDGSGHVSCTTVVLQGNLCPA